MRILVSGSHGLIGSALLTALESAGVEVLPLVRTRVDDGKPGVSWNPDAGSIDADRLENLDAVVHLAGESLASGRWTNSLKARIRESRVQGTDLLSRTLAGLRCPPRTFLSASAVGYYGNRGDKVLTEETLSGSGFLAEVCREWEEATRPASQAGVRVALLRFAMVLDAHGGALAKMLPLFRKGLGGPLGGGGQYWSWIMLEDAIGAIVHILNTRSLSGPVNLSSPSPVTNREFTECLGKALGKPAFIAAPAFALRVAVGEMADEALLASTRVMPAKLRASGFAFRYEDLEEALGTVLQKGR